MKFSRRLWFAALAVLVPVLAWASVTVTVNGSSYTIPQSGEKGWGSSVTSWIQAMSSNTLQPSGGSFTLTSEVDFGSSYGLKSTYVKSRALNPSSAGTFRLGNAESIGWRNAGNSADYLLTVNSSNQLTFNGVVLSSATGPLFQDSLFSLFDNSDATKLLQFQLSGITTGTTRTLTVPDASTTLVGTDTTQTLTNKTLTAPVISTISNTGTLTLPTATTTLVGRDTTDTLTNKTLTAPVISTISNTGTLTLPTSTDTLVGRATTDTLTNKTISGASNTITNVSLTSGVTGTLPVGNGGIGQTTLTNHGVLVGAATSGVIALPAAGAGTVLGGVASSDPAFTTAPVIGLAGTATGTIGLSGTTSGTVTIQPQAAAGTYNFNLPTTAGSSGQVLTSGGGGSTAMTWASPFTNPMTTTGDIVYSSDNSGTPARLAKGTTGQALLQGASIPAWSTIGWRQIGSTQTASSSGTIDFTGLDNTYTRYMITWDSVKPATNNVTFQLRIGTGGTPTYQTSSYAHAGIGRGSGGATATNDSTSAGAIDLTGASGLGSGAGQLSSGFVQFSNPANSDYPAFQSNCYYITSTPSIVSFNASGFYGSAGAFTAVRFLMSSGNIASGTFRLWGM